MTGRLYDSFVLDKVDDVLVFANCLYQTGQYHRAIAVVKNRTDVKVCEHAYHLELAITTMFR